MPPETPRPSVVIASKQAAAQLETCLEALAAQGRVLDAEIVIARDPSAGPITGITDRFQELVVCWGRPGASIPELRGLGLAASTGDPVALTEDHLVPTPDWLPGLIQAVSQDWDVVGGGMANAARGRLIDWAAYFSDYGFYSVARPERPGPPLLTAANIIYRRAVVGDVAKWAQEGAWENVVHDRLLAAGRRIRFERGARMLHVHRYRFRDFWRNRFQHGRDYAWSRLAEDPNARPWLRGLTAPALLPVLFGRIARASWREAPLAFWLAAPVTAALVGGWVVGEMVGYFGGRPGK